MSEKPARDVVKMAFRIVKKNKQAKAALSKHPGMLGDIWKAIYALEDRVAKLENPKRGRMRDEVTAQLEQLFEHACGVIGDVDRRGMPADEAKRQLKKFVRNQEIAAAKARGASDPGGAAKMSRKRNKPKP